MQNNEKGMALITTLVLGLIALVFIGALLYILTTGTRISGTEKRYSTALEAAKGGAQFVINEILMGDLKCNGGNPCKTCSSSLSNDCKIDLPVSKLGNYEVNAYLLSKESSGVTAIYSVRVKSFNPDVPNEKAEIEFVYKVQ